MTFEELRAVAIRQKVALTTEHEPPDTDTGASAVIVADALFEWIAANVTDPKRRADVAAHVVAALGLERA